MILGKERKITESPCPNCNYNLDVAFGIGNNTRPKEGDITVCISCGHPALFTSDMKLTPVPAEHLANVLNDPRIRQAQEAASLARAMKTYDRKPKG